MLRLVYLMSWLYQVNSKIYTSKLHKESQFKNGGSFNIHLSETCQIISNKHMKDSQYLYSLAT